jgi:hypothetical protein
MSFNFYFLSFNGQNQTANLTPNDSFGHNVYVNLQMDMWVHFQYLSVNTFLMVYKKGSIEKV